MKLPTILFLSAIALTAAAEDIPWNKGGGMPFAQMDQEQRRELRQRWREASPEQRMEMWQRFQERMRQRHMRKFGMQDMPNMGAMDFMGMGSGFGAGFEQRKNEDIPSDYPYDQPHSRHGRGNRQSGY